MAQRTRNGISARLSGRGNVGAGARPAAQPDEAPPTALRPHNFLHAASIVALADTTCGYATLAYLPEGAAPFTTIELKSNHLGTVREGTLVCEARTQHLGRTMQVWDAVVTDAPAGRILALFRCTQMILWPKTP